jgi:hypothetical protein
MLHSRIGEDTVSLGNRPSMKLKTIFQPVPPECAFI